MPDDKPDSRRCYVVSVPDGSDDRTLAKASGDVPCPHCEDKQPKTLEKCPVTGLSIDRALRMQGEILDKKYELEGDDLGDVLDMAEKLLEPTTVHVVLQILAALKAIHEKDIVHRDLKPENVFVVKDHEGGIEIKIVDFGISQFRPSGAGPRMSTITGRVFGTPMYCSPEQARDAKSVDLRTDIYSAGVILYEMLTG